MGYILDMILAVLGILLLQQQEPTIEPFDGPVKMSFKLSGNTTLSYKFLMDSNVVLTLPDGMGEKATKISLDYSLKYSIGEPAKADPTKNVIICESNVNSYKADDTVISKDAPPVKLAGIIDNRGRVHDMRILGERPKGRLAQMGIMVSQQSQWMDLPEGEVKVGDTWLSEQIPNPILNPKPGNFVVKLLGQATVGGKKAWACSYSGKVEVDADFTPFLEDSDRNDLNMTMMKVVGSFTLDGMVYIDQQTGYTLMSKTKVRDTQRIRMSESVAVDTASKGNSTLHLVKVEPGN